MNPELLCTVYVKVQVKNRQNKDLFLNISKAILFISEF